MANKIDRIILDTNLWISFLITKDYSSLDKLIFSKKAVLIFSDELLTEFIDVSQRPKFKKYFSKSDVEDILETIDEYAIFIAVTSAIDECKDKKDNFLLSLCMDGKADYLLTGDNDLLEIKKIGKTRILKISDYFSRKF